MNPDHAIGIGFSDMAQFVKVGRDEFWSALAQNPEDFRRLHAYFILTVEQ